MTVVAQPKNKQQEKALKAFLNSLEIGYYTEVEEDAALLAAMQKGRKSRLLTTEEKKMFCGKLKNAE